MSDWSQGFLAFYLCFCLVSLAGSLFVASSILRFGFTALPSKALLYLHCTQLILDGMAIPYIWWYNPTICAIVGFLRTYAGVGNAICAVILVIAYRYIFFTDTHKICDFCLRNLNYIVFGFPLLCVLCFSTNNYTRVSNNLCSFHHSDGAASDVWTILYGIFALIVLVCCVFVFLRTVYEVFKSDKLLAAKLFSTLVLYALATLFRITFQAISISPSVQLLVNIMVFSSGIAYTLIFIADMGSIKKFEQQNQAADIDVESVAGDNSMSFSMSEDDFKTSISDQPAIMLKGFTHQNSTNNPMTDSTK